MIAEIIPEKRAFDKDFYSYIVPYNLTGDVKVGSICHVPFGKKTIRGVIASIQNTNNSHACRQAGIQAKYKLKEILDVSDVVIPKSYIEIAEWISKYFLCSLGEAVALFLPPTILRPKKIEETRYKKQPVSPGANRGGDTNNIQLSIEQNEIYEQLEKKFIYCSSLSRTKTNTSSQSPSALSNNNKALLFGVTGSGKTEIYLKLVEKCLKDGKQAIILVPEIMLTPQIVGKFEECFPDQVTVMHSHLTEKDRFLAYDQFTAGDKQILIGPRSALLVPSNSLGLIIIDEEQEDAYKQEKSPRYHAITLAEEIAKKTGAYLLLGTATPRIESYYKTKSDLYDIFILNNRYHKLILPPAEVVDLREEIKKENYSPISIKMQSAISAVLKNKKQIILFLNRRGMSTFVSCRDCGFVVLCPKCDIPLVYHLNEKYNGLSCHHCDYTASIPTVCPECQSSKIKFFGAGIEKIESEIKKQFPKARVRVIEGKSIKNKNDLAKLHADLKNGKIDILIGTQILAKGLDLENIDMVGIISADVGMHMPHFRAMEKTFQIITQVSGRSGRKHNVGQTIIQTYWPESKAISLASQHDFNAFYKSEITDREELGYPPFCHLIRVVSEDANAQKAKKEIDSVAEKLKSEGIKFIGPGKCFFSKLHNRFRYHLIIKTKKWPETRIYSIFKSNPYLIWDAEPVDLL